MTICPDWKMCPWDTLGMSLGCQRDVRGYMGDIRVLSGGTPVIPFREQVNTPDYSGAGSMPQGRYRPPLRRVLLAFALAENGSLT